MKKKMKIMVVEDDDLHRATLINLIDKEENIQVVAATSSDEEAVLAFTEHLPHVIILDLEIHTGAGSGISFLKKLNELDVTVSPFILVATYNNSRVVHTRVRDLGADFIMSKMQKDYSPELIVTFLNDMMEVIMSSRPSDSIQSSSAISYSPAQNSKRLLNRLNAEFDHIQMSHKLSGRRYLIEVIRLIIEENCTESMAIKTVSESSQKTNIATIQAMTNVIKKTWATADMDTLYKHYSGIVRSDTGVPTVTEFIYYYVDKISYSD